MTRTDIDIDIDDDVIAAVQSLYGLRTKQDAVDFALRRLLVEPMTVDEARAMRGTGWAGSLDELRDGTRVRLPHSSDRRRLNGLR